MNSKLMDTGNDYPETCWKAHPLTILRANSRRTLKEYFKNLTDEEVEYLCDREDVDSTPHTHKKTHIER